VEKLENYQRLHWDVFYKNNKDHFYKDRHYLRYEFKELIEACGGTYPQNQPSKDNDPSEEQKKEGDEVEAQD